MDQNARFVLYAAVFAVVTFTYGGYSAPWWLGLLAPALIYSLLLPWIMWRRLQARMQWRRFIRELRAHHPSRVAAHIANIPLVAVQREIERELARHGSFVADDGVETFPFSSVDRREIKALWMGAALTAPSLLILAAGVGNLAPLGRWCAGVSGVMVGTVGIVTLRHSRVMESVIEVSPFGVIWALPDGTRQRVSWIDPLVLQFRRKGSLWLLTSLRSEISIPLHMARVGSERALERVWELGGFEATDTHS